MLNIIKHELGTGKTNLEVPITVGVITNYCLKRV